MRKLLIESGKILGIMTMLVFIWCIADLAGIGEIVMNESELGIRIILAISLYLNLKAYEKYKS